MVSFICFINFVAFHNDNNFNSKAKENKQNNVIAFVFFNGYPQKVFVTVRKNRKEKEKDKKPCLFQ